MREHDALEHNPQVSLEALEGRICTLQTDMLACIIHE